MGLTACRNTLRSRKSLSHHRITSRLMLVAPGPHCWILRIHKRMLGHALGLQHCDSMMMIRAIVDAEKDIRLLCKQRGLRC